MIRIGDYNELQVLRFADFGAYLGDLDSGKEILLPKRYFPEDLQQGDYLDVFVYTDSEDRLICTTERPLAKVNECAFLEVVDVNAYGAFLNWGLMKDLFVPYAHQPYKFHVGRKAFVYLMYDKVSERMIATGKVRKYMKTDASKLEVGQPMKGVVYEKHELGYRMVLDHQYQAMIYNSNFEELPELGDELNVFIKDIRRDGKIDVSLFPVHRAVQGDLEEFILKLLGENDGFLKLDAKSSSEEVKDILGVSRKVFKKALGALYKNKKVDFEDGGTRLL